MGRKRWIYAMYKGEKFICEGTKAEICEEMGIKPKTFEYYRSNYYKTHRESRYNNHKYIIRVDGEDKIYG